MPDLDLLSLYACAAQPAGWARVLDQLGERTGACSAVMQCFRLGEAGPQIVWQLSDSRTPALPTDGGGVVASTANPRFDRHRLARGLGRVVRDDDLFDAAEPARERLRQGLAALGLGDFLGSLVELPDGRLLGIALHGPAQGAPAFSADAAQCLAALTPHLVQAASLGHALLAAQQERSQLQRLADQWRCGLVLCDEAGRVRWLNRPAQDLVAAGPTVLRLEAGQLRAVGANAGAWRAALTRATREAEGRTHYLRLSTRASEPGAPALLAALRSVRTAGGDGLAVALTSAAAAVDAPAQAWSALFGLTPAEGSLVRALVAGATLAEHAAARGIAVGTARNQLKQVLAKTGAGRQSELVRRALASAAASMAGADGA